MKSLPIDGLGQHDLKGKKTKKLPCKCCTMTNLKQKEIDRLHKKDMTLR